MWDKYDDTLLRFSFLEEIIMGLVMLLLCASVLNAYPIFDETTGLTTGYIPHLWCGIMLIKVVPKLPTRKPRFIEQLGELTYKHEILGKVERKLSVFFQVLLLIVMIIISMFFDPYFPYENPLSIWLIAPAFVLVNVWIFSSTCRSLYGFWCGYKLKIKVALSKKEVYVLYPYGEDLWRSAIFQLDEIIEARVVTAEDPQIRQDLITTSGFIPRPNKKRRNGPYMYAFFLGDTFPLPDGHQAVELKLKNGRHVLIETDDAENFIAALRKSGVGGVYKCA